MRYLRKEKAKLAGGAFKFQIMQELEETKSELEELQEQGFSKTNSEMQNILTTLLTEIQRLRQ